MWAMERVVMSDQSIFITDDDSATRALLQDLLVEEGYTQVESVPRHEVLAAAQREPPAVLLLDVHGAQPCAGRVLLGQLRHEPRTASVAVIICSTMRRETWQHSAHGGDSGDGYVEKPFQVAELLYQIQALLGPPACDVTA